MQLFPGQARMDRSFGTVCPKVSLSGNPAGRMKHLEAALEDVSIAGDLIRPEPANEFAHTSGRHHYPHSSGRKRKATVKRPSLSCWRYLFCRAVASQVSSAEMSLTTVFGMGTGGPSS